MNDNLKETYGEELTFIFNKLSEYANNILADPIKSNSEITTNEFISFCYKLKKSLNDDELMKKCIENFAKYFIISSKIEMSVNKCIKLIVYKYLEPILSEEKLSTNDEFMCIRG